MRSGMFGDLTESGDPGMVENLTDVMAEVIRRRRNELGLTVGALAEMSNVDIGTISRTENGHTQLTLDTAVRLCRALGLSLFDLTGNEGKWREQFQVRGLGILESDIVDLLSIYRRDPNLCEETLSRWIDLIQTNIGDTSRPNQRISLSAIGLANFLGEHPLFRFSLRFPVDVAAEVLIETHRLGGKLHDEDLQSLILHLTTDPVVYRGLSRQDRDVLRRLQSSSPDRVRYADIVELSETLQVDLLGIFGNTVDLDMPPSYIDDPAIAMEMRNLITLFVTISVWLRRMLRNEQQWLQLIRSDLEVK